MPDAPKKAKLPVGPNQELKDAVIVEVVSSKEPWCEYQLADGTTFKLKPVVAEIWRTENEFDSEGNPVYVIKASNIVNVSSPDELKRKK